MLPLCIVSVLYVTNITILSTAFLFAVLCIYFMMAMTVTYLLFPESLRGLRIFRTGTRYGRYYTLLVIDEDLASEILEERKNEQYERSEALIDQNLLVRYSRSHVKVDTTEHRKEMEETPEHQHEYGPNVKVCAFCETPNRPEDRQCRMCARML